MSHLPTTGSGEELRLESPPDEVIVEPLPIPADEGGIHRQVWRLAWPLVVGMVFQTMNGFIDRIFVGHLGPSAVAAVGLGSQFYFMLFAVGMAISVGATALVARAAGAGDTGGARLAAHQSLWVALAASLACMLPMLPLAPYLVSAMGIDAASTALCTRYLRLTLLGIPTLFLLLTLSAVYRGLGDMRTPMVVQIIANVVHVAGDWLLIFGNLGFPRLGLEGGAVALVVSQVVATAVCLLLLRRTAVAELDRMQGGLQLDWARRILRIGIPAAIQTFSRVLSGLMFTGILARSIDGTAAVAALTIGLTSESIAFMPGIAYSTAASTMTGQALGARQPDQARASARAALVQGVVVMSAMGLLFWVFAREFAMLFTRDPQVLRLAEAYLKIVALSEPGLALTLVLAGALNGAGETRGPAMASVVSMWFVRLPLAFLFAVGLSLGAVGAWWSMTISTLLGGLLMHLLFRSDRWLHVRV